MVYTKENINAEKNRFKKTSWHCPFNVNKYRLVALNVRSFIFSRELYNPRIYLRLMADRVAMTTYPLVFSSLHRLR